MFILHSRFQKLSSCWTQWENARVFQRPLMDSLIHRKETSGGILCTYRKMQKRLYDDSNFSVIVSCYFLFYLLYLFLHNLALNMKSLSPSLHTALADSYWSLTWVLPVHLLTCSSSYFCLRPCFTLPWVHCIVYFFLLTSTSLSIVHPLYPTVSVSLSACEEPNFLTRLFVRL